MENRTEETKEKLLKAGKAEFLEKGFLGASLRNICKNADVTTGALYFFFKDKEDLFDSIVKDFADQAVSILKEHLAAEKSMFAADGTIASLENPTYEQLMEIFTADNKPEMADDALVSQKIFDLVYDNYDCTQLLLSKAAGTKYEHFADSLIQLTENHVREYLAPVCKLLKREMPTAYCMHWISHLMIDTYVSLFLHIKNKKEALQNMPALLACTHAAFYTLIK